MKLSLAAVAVFLGMKYVFPILLPFFIAFVIAQILHPLAEKIEKKTRLKRTMACALTYMLFLLLLFAVVAGLCFLCYKMGSSCMENIGDITGRAEEFWCICCQKIEALFGISMDALEEGLSLGTGRFTDGAMHYSKEAGRWAIGFFAKMFVTFVATLLILNDYNKIREAVLKSRAGCKIKETVHNMKKAAGAYLKAQFMILLVVSAICVVGLLLTKNKYAIPAGLAIGACDALPFLGTGVVFIPWVLIDILMGNYKMAAIHMAIYLICTFTRQILEPKLVGTKLGVHPLAVLISIYVGIRIYGGVGVLLGPVTGLILWELWRDMREEEGI